MSRVTLAYRWEGHEPDETVEVDDATAVQLVRDGVARPAEPDQLAPDAPTPPITADHEEG